MQVEHYMRQHRQVVEEALEHLLPPADTPPSELHQAMRYSVLAPGKRLRPILVIASAEAVGGCAASVLPAACALECIHAFSLIHDDLPCMDDDQYRRGRLTCHMAFGEAIALLAGDALLALAFELIAGNAAGFAPERVVDAIRLVAQACGAGGMVGGQVTDMLSQGQPVNADLLDRIHARKTGALLTASAMLGALLADASEEQMVALESYGRRLGLAFQIADDVLDITGDEQKIGKPVGSDERQDKATYPKLYGVEESRRRAREVTDLAILSIAGFGPEADPLRALAEFAVERDL